MADKKEAPKTKNYVLKVGKHSGRDEDGNIVDYVVGDEVPLTDTAYEAFKDKFEAPKAEKRRAEKEGLAPGEPASTPTAPKAPDGDGKSQAQPGPEVDKSKPGDNKTGAGAAANSTNVAR